MPGIIYIMNYLLILLVLLLLTVIGLVANKYVLGSGVNAAELNRFSLNLNGARDNLYNAAIWFIEARNESANIRLFAKINNLTRDYIKLVGNYYKYRTVFYTFANTFKSFKNDYAFRFSKLLEYDLRNEYGSKNPFTKDERKTIEGVIKDQFDVNDIKKYNKDYMSESFEDILHAYVWSILESLSSIRLNIDRALISINQKFILTIEEKYIKEALTTFNEQVLADENYLFKNPGII